LIIGRAFGPAVDRNRGFHGYKSSFLLGTTKAIFAYGGNNQTGLLSFPGEACHQIPDWLKLVGFLRDELGGRITRLDGAVDDFEGRHTVNDSVTMYQAGLFNAGGRKPKIKQYGNWLEPDGSGRTFQIGSRKNGKMIRIYEKGMEQGVPWHPWVRWEVEWHNRDRIIPWEAILEPGKYLAGAYPKALAWVSDEQSRIRTLTHTAQLGYAALNHWHSVAYGKHIDVMMDVEGSADKVIEILRRKGFPSRLDLPSIPGYGKVSPSCKL
jgi:phage replication initiation protein